MSVDISAWVKTSEAAQKYGWRWITYKTFKDPTGDEREFATFGRSGTNNVAVIALTKEKKVVVAKQFRHGPEVMFWELPGGKANEGEELWIAAQRELSEETGYATDKPFIYLGKACRDAYTNDVNSYFLAVDCYERGDQHTDDGEFVEACEIGIDELIKNAKGFRMSDSAGVLLALDKLEEIVG